MLHCLSIIFFIYLFTYFFIFIYLFIYLFICENKINLFQSVYYGLILEVHSKTLLAGRL